MKTINTLSLETVKEMLIEMHKGGIGSIRYFSTPKTVDGSVIYKVSGGSIRTKFDHTASKNYVEPTYHRTEDSTYIIEDALKHNNKTGSDLLKIAPIWEKNIKGKMVRTFGNNVEYYDAEWNIIEKAKALALIEPTKKSGNIPQIITVKANQIISLKVGD